MAMNFWDYFDKLSEMYQTLGELCPVFDRIQRLYPSSAELCEAVCAFYATVISFCTKALEFLKTDGRPDASLSCLPCG